MPLHFELVTPEKLLRSEEVFMVTVPGAEGDFGVLEGHAPFMSTVRDGALAIQRTAGGPIETLSIEGGFAEVGANGLTVLAERAGDVVSTGKTAATSAASPKAPDRI